MALYPFKLYLSDRFIRVSLIVSAILGIALWWYTLANIPKTQDNIFLHYNIIFGLDLIGPWWKALYTPGIGTLAILANFGFSYATYQRARFVAYLLATFTPVLYVLLFAGQVVIVGLNN